MKKLRDQLMLFSRASKKESRLSREWVSRLDLDDFEDREFLRKTAKRLAKAADNWQKLAHEFNKKAAIGRATILPAPDALGAANEQETDKAPSARPNAA